MEGYIKLYRKLLENPIFQNEKLLKVFIWCLLKATHKVHEQLVGLQKITFQPGQFVYGRFKCAEELGLSPGTLDRLMRWLKDENIISIKSSNKFSVVTIEKWELYQSDEKETSSKRAANEQQMSTNKNGKNDKNKDIYIGCSENLQRAICDFIEMRKKLRKPMTDKAIQIMLKKLDGIAKDELTKIQILEQSIERGWLSVFPLKQDKPAAQLKPPPQATNFKQREYSPEFYEKLIGKK